MIILERTIHLPPLELHWSEIRVFQCCTSSRYAMLANVVVCDDWNRAVRINFIGYMLRNTTIKDDTAERIWNTLYGKF